MTFVLLALSKDTTIYIQLGVENNREKTFVSKKRIDLQFKTRRANHCTTTPAFKYSVGCLPK